MTAYRQNAPSDHSHRTSDHGWLRRTSCARSLQPSALIGETLDRIAAAA